jgi:outer membrane protein assembly factor BamD (BamD/ComL family)
MKLIVFLLCALLVVSCASGPIVIEDALSAAELVQRGQTAYDWSRYAEAYQYYSEVLTRFPDDIEANCEAEYAISRLHYKQKKYDLARDEALSLLARYDSPDAELLPPRFRILSNIVLSQIEEKAK